MKKKIMILSILLILLPFSGNLAGGIGFGYSAALAQDEAPDSAGGASVEGEASADEGKSIASGLSGEVTTSGVIAGVSGSKAKFNEFRDIDTGVYGGVKLKYDDDNYFAKFKASDIGYDTQNYKLEGGIYGMVKYFMEYNEIPHNWTDGAKTVYNGVGSNNLTLMPSALSATSSSGKIAAPPVNSWNTFDYSIKRQQESAGARIDFLKPFYLEFSANREDRAGVRPNGITYSDAGSHSGPIGELPTPLNYVTQIFRGEAGYITKPLFASVNLMYTDFSNANQVLNFQSGNGKPDALTLPPNDQSYRAGFRGSVALPLNTRLNVSLSGTDTKSNANLLGSYMTNNALPNSIVPIKYSDGATVWNGDVRTQNYAFVLNSNPVSFLNANLFFKYYNKDNRSDEITASASITATPTVTTNETLSYHKDDFGANLMFKLPANFMLTTGYEYLRVDRNYEVLPKTTDNVYSAGLKKYVMDFMLVKVGYERLNRDGKAYPAPETEGPSVYDPRTDAASQHRDMFKAGVDLYPLDNLSFGLLYKYKRSTYPDNLYGLQNNRKEEYTLDADYAFARFAKFDGYIEYENEKFNNFQHVGSLLSPYPVWTVSNSAYNWSLAQRDRTYNFGAGLDIYVIPKKMTLRFQYDYVNSDGNADYTMFSPAYLGLGTALPNPGSAVRNNDNVDIHDWDDYKKSSFLVKSTFNVSKSFTVAVGYCFEHFKYNDVAFDNYSYTIVDNALTGNGSGNVSYLTGAYANPSYNASIIFLSGTYRF